MIKLVNRCGIASSFEGKRRKYIFNRVTIPSSISVYGPSTLITFGYVDAQIDVVSGGIYVCSSTWLDRLWSTGCVAVNLIFTGYSRFLFDLFSKSNSFATFGAKALLIKLQTVRTFPFLSLNLKLISHGWHAIECAGWNNLVFFYLVCWTPVDGSIISNRKYKGLFLP